MNSRDKRIAIQKKARMIKCKNCKVDKYRSSNNVANDYDCVRVVLDLEMNEWCKLKPQIITGEKDE